jgi:hypothetical protein
MSRVQNTARSFYETAKLFSSIRCTSVLNPPTFISSAVLGRKLFQRVLRAILLTMAFSVQAEPKVTYAGDGRYTCSGNGSQSAQIDANNRQREAQRQADYQREQDRAQAVIDRMRSDDERLK